jgi:hypothetical protein
VLRAFPRQRAASVPSGLWLLLLLIAVLACVEIAVRSDSLRLPYDVCVRFAVLGKIYPNFLNGGWDAMDVE